ncbi:DEAD/DEAH box helicase [Mucilaginibacter corticis]|uniref:DEAD/DEAH box helicase n=1 Tax=Mucilaginibacter corticis TaxID=2597670 RepID=A0A556M8V9_9SPHI|nr:DEAD/DEAH box helicase [Mucilaginibacter corticis]TSJ36367.1 DEAD/DEAH box helicase [Mucilaginibacter corticis]
MLNQLYPYQARDLDILFERLEHADEQYRLLYQLPTGGGKTRIFSEIANRYNRQFGKKVMVLTHREELCSQTSLTLKSLGIRNKVINSQVKQLAARERYACFVAMVETLKNRMESGIINTDDVGLVIIDEAHHNSFHKLLGKFKRAAIIGVTATPFSSDINLPMNKHYRELVVGESIGNLIAEGYLARPSTWRYDVELNTLQTGISGDFTVATSDALYSSPAMLELLQHAYQTHAKNKKTLIFNNGIFTSKAVLARFRDAGYPIRHLDNHTPPAERAEILQWFKRTKSAILTSVSILTTGFDEPTVQTVILNRATTSLTLYHQMIGRGARRLPQKKTFNIIDLGNNTERFGEWQTPIDWQEVFERPEAYHEALHSKTEFEAHHLTGELRLHFPNTLQLSFDVQEAHQRAVANQLKSKIVIRDAIRQHALMCADNSDNVTEALALTELLDKEIAWRVKQYAKCLGRVTKNYTEWLQDDYKARLNILVAKIMNRRALHRLAG